MPLPKKIPRAHTVKEKGEQRVLANRYSLDKKLGSGNFGTAFLVQDRKTKESKEEWKVLKEISVGDLQPDETVDAMHEARLLSKLDHPGIVKFHDSFIDSDFFCIITEYCEGGDLTDRIDEAKKSGQVFSESLVMDWFIQLILAVQYMHSRRVLHRDLKTRNIFLKNNMVKIGDFGISRMLMGTSDLATTFVGTPYYMSPEVLKHEGYNSKSDVWSIGCILFELCSLKHAFDGQSLMGVMYKIVEGEIPEIPNKYSKDVQRIIKLVLNKDPQKRPSATEVTKLSFVSKHIEKMKNTIVEKHHRDHHRDSQEVLQKEAEDLAQCLGQKSHLSDLRKEEDDKYTNMSPRERMRLRKQQQADNQARMLREATAETFQTNQTRNVAFKQRESRDQVGKLLGTQKKSQYSQHRHIAVPKLEVPRDRMADFGYNRPTTAPAPSSSREEEHDDQQASTGADRFGQTLPTYSTVVLKPGPNPPFDDRPITPMKDKLVYDIQNSSLDGIPENPQLAETYYSQFDDEFDESESDSDAGSDYESLASYMQNALDISGAEQSMTFSDDSVVGAFGPGARDIKIKNLRADCENKLGKNEFSEAYKYLKNARFADETIDESDIMDGLKKYVKNPSDCFLVDQLLFLEEQSNIGH